MKRHRGLHNELKIAAAAKSSLFMAGLKAAITKLSLQRLASGQRHAGVSLGEKHIGGYQLMQRKAGAKLSSISGENGWRQLSRISCNIAVSLMYSNWRAAMRCGGSWRRVTAKSEMYLPLQPAHRGWRSCGGTRLLLSSLAASYTARRSWRRFTWLKALFMYAAQHQRSHALASGAAA